MRFSCIFILLGALASSAYGYSFVIPTKIDHPGFCIYNGLFLQRGDNQLPSSCQNMRCNDDGSILVQGCGNYDMTDCRVVDPINLDKPYPDCCKMNFICNTIAGLQNRVVSPLDRRVYA